MCLILFMYLFGGEGTLVVAWVWRTEYKWGSQFSHADSRDQNLVKFDSNKHLRVVAALAESSGSCHICSDNSEL